MTGVEPHVQEELKVQPVEGAVPEFPQQTGSSEFPRSSISHVWPLGP